LPLNEIYQKWLLWFSSNTIFDNLKIIEDEKINNKIFIDEDGLIWIFNLYQGGLPKNYPFSPEIMIKKYNELIKIMNNSNKFSNKFENWEYDKEFWDSEYFPEDD